MKLGFLRHASPLQIGLCYGWSDVLVRSLSVQECDDLRLCYTSHGCPTVVSSPAQRCRVLADILCRDEYLWQTDARLRELNFGDWEGRYWQDLPREETENWTQDWWNTSPPHGESFNDLCFRVQDFLSELIVQDRDCWVVAHAGSLRVLWALCTQQDPKTCLGMPIPYAQPLFWESGS